MAVTGTTVLTLADWASRVEDNYKIANIVELLSTTNEILLDMLFVEGNLPTGHQTTVRTGLPSATWRLLNYGVAKSKSTTAKITDTLGNIEAYAEVDKDIADLGGNTLAFRASESVAFLEGINQQVATMLFYGNQATNPERFTGLTPRYNTVTGAASANNVLDAGGEASTNTSMWMVTWGERVTHGFFPKGKVSGLQHSDKGQVTLADENGNPYEGYRDHYKWELGLSVRDWRYNVRIANIDVALLNGGSAANIINLLVRAFHRLPTASPRVSSVQSTGTAPGMGQGPDMGRTVIYANRTIATYLDLQAMNKSNVFLTLGDYQGRVVTSFRGIPIRNCDALLNTEARVV